jgi:hypothetical protein
VGGWRLAAENGHRVDHAVAADDGDLRPSAVESEVLGEQRPA